MSEQRISQDIKLIKKLLKMSIKLKSESDFLHTSLATIHVGLMNTNNEMIENSKKVNKKDMTKEKKRKTKNNKLKELKKSKSRLFPDSGIIGLNENNKEFEGMEYYDYDNESIDLPMPIKQFNLSQ